MSWLLIFLALYGAAGVAFAVAFLARGLGRVDAAAAHASIAFRLLILPGVAALWPLMLGKWRRAGART